MKKQLKLKKITETPLEPSKKKNQLVGLGFL